MHCSKQNIFSTDFTCSLSLAFTALILLFLTFRAGAQDTFSIVAVDTVTGEIGSARASSPRITPDLSSVSGPGIMIYLVRLPDHRIIGKGKFMKSW